MSNQVEQIRAEVERRIKSWKAGIKYEGDAGDCQSRVTELTDLKKFIDSVLVKESSILVPADAQEDADKAAEKYGKEYTILPDEYNDDDIPVYEGWTAGAFKDGILYERERIIKMVETAGARFMQRVDIVPEDEASLKLSMYCTELVEQIKSQTNS